MAATENWKYNVNDLVWVEMKGFPPFPGRVTEPPTDKIWGDRGENSKCIFFFGSDHYSWLDIDCLKPFFEFRNSLSYTNEEPHFKSTIKAVEQYIQDNNIGRNNGVPEVDNRFENLVNNVTPTPPAKKKVSVPRTPASNSAVKRPRKSQAEVVNTNSDRSKRKKSRMNSSTSKSNTDIITNHGLTRLVNTSRLRKNIQCTPASNSAVKRPRKSQAEVVNTNSDRSKRKKSRMNSSTNNSNTDILTNLELTNNHTSPLRKNNTLLDRPSEVRIPENSLLDVTKISKSLQDKDIHPSTLRFGFIGLENIGSGIVKNLLNAGHTVMVWNRIPEKSQQFEDIGALVGLNPSDVVSGSDITFSCFSDPHVAKEMVYGNCGVLSEISHGKGFVEMSGIDAETSVDIGEVIIAKGGRYLEAVIQGSGVEAEGGSLVCIAAGNKSLYDDCEIPFQAISKTSVYLGKVGAATKMNLILHIMETISLAGLAFCMALADKVKISRKDLWNILKMTEFNSAMLLEKVTATMENNFTINEALKK